MVNDDVYIYVEDIPEVITPLMMSMTKPKNGDEVTTVATGGTVQEAIYNLRSFLPGAESGHFSLQEVAAILMHHIKGHGVGDDCANEASARTLKSMFVPKTEDDNQNKENLQNDEDEVQSWRYTEKERTRPERYSSNKELHREEANSKNLPSKIARYPTTLSPESSRPKEYFLPTRGNLHDRLRGEGGRSRAISEADVVKEFAKLDLSGEGRLTFLTVKSALELMSSAGTLSNDEMDDVVIRAWLRDHDRGSKGYVDYSDFRYIFSEILSGNSVGQREPTPHRYAGTQSEKDFLQAKEQDDRVNRLKS